MWFSKKRYLFLFSGLLLLFSFFIYRVKFNSSWWQIATHGENFLSPIVTNNNVYWTNNLGEVYSLKKSTGKIVWTIQLPARDPYSLSAYMDKLFVFTPSGRVFCLSAKNGKLLWSFATEDQSNLLSYFHIKNNSAYINSSNANIYAINLRNGSLEWKFSSQKSLSSVSNNGSNLFGKLESNNGKLIFASIDGNIYKINPKTGKVIWQNYVGGFVTATQLKNNIFYFAKESGEIIGLSSKSGETLYSDSENKDEILCFRDISFWQSLPNISSLDEIKHALRNSLLFITNGGKVISISSNLGKKEENFDLKSRPTDCPTIINNYGYISNKDGLLFGFRPHSKITEQYIKLDSFLLFNSRFISSFQFSFLNFVGRVGL